MVVECRKREAEYLRSAEGAWGGGKSDWGGLPGWGVASVTAAATGA